MFRATEAQMSAVRHFLPLLVPYGVTLFTRGESGPDVEVLSDSTGIVSAELITDSQRYFDYHHAGNDIFEKVNKRELELGAINLAALLYLIDRYGL